jgi:hypothetical protein
LTRRAEYIYFLSMRLSVRNTASPTIRALTVSLLLMAFLTASIPAPEGSTPFAVHTHGSGFVHSHAESPCHAEQTTSIVPPVAESSAYHADTDQIPPPANPVFSLDRPPEAA